MNISIGFHFIIPQKHIRSSSAYKYCSYSFGLSAVITVFINFKYVFLDHSSFLNKFTESWTQEAQFESITLHFWNTRLIGHSCWRLMSNVLQITYLYHITIFWVFLSMSSLTVLEHILLIPMTHHQVWPFYIFSIDFIFHSSKDSFFFSTSKVFAKGNCRGKKVLCHTEWEQVNANFKKQCRVINSRVKWYN